MDPLKLTGQVLFPDGVLRPGEVTISDGLIADVRALESAPDQIIAPGFIDLQLNGGYGHDFTANPETIYHVAAHVLQTGVTAYLPTIITAPLESFRRALDALSPLDLFSRSGKQLASSAFTSRGRISRHSARARITLRICGPLPIRWQTALPATACA